MELVSIYLCSLVILHLLTYEWWLSNRLTKDDIQRTGGGAMLRKYYDGSVVKALATVFPQRRRIKRSRWKSMENQRAFFDWIGILMSSAVTPNLQSHLLAYIHHYHTSHSHTPTKLLTLATLDRHEVGSKDVGRLVQHHAERRDKPQHGFIRLDAPSLQKLTITVWVVVRYTRSDGVTSHQSHHCSVQRIAMAAVAIQPHSTRILGRPQRYNHHTVIM